ncbi:MAG: type IX secretion system membrane protein PorP/SprF [Flavobacteriales bacterium]|nr:type IX secretion system membrane protein PorP/SprF [Flavobacteriales bacterium]
MRKNLFLVFILLVIVGQSKGQQHSLYSQYIFNLYAINPAYAGERNAAATALSYRNQWVGFEGSPKTAYFSAHSPIRNNNLAIGLWFQNDQVGAREHSSFHGTVSYKLRLDKNRRLSFALSGGALNHRYNWNELDFPDGSDPVAFVNEPNQWRPIFDFGMMYLARQGYAGISILNINSPDLSALDVIDVRLNPSMNLIGGYIFPISKKIDLKPSTLIRAQTDGSWTLDANLSARFIDKLWVTLTYRYQFGMVFSGHLYINDNFHFGYSYDLTTNSLLSQQSGTHEIFIGYDIGLYRNKSSARAKF